MMTQGRPRAVTRTGTTRAISALLSISLLCSCGLQWSQAYKRAFDPPGRKVLVVLAGVGHSVSVPSVSSEAEGLSVGVLQSIGAVFSIVYIPFIPVLISENVKEGAAMGKILNANPDWKPKLEAWFAKRRLDELFRSELQSYYKLEPNPYPVSFSSSEAALDYFAKDRPRNLTVIVIPKVEIRMIKFRGDCPDCARFLFVANFQLIDGESGEVLLHDNYYSGVQDFDALPFPDYLTDDFARLDAALTSAVKRTAKMAEENFRLYR